MPDHVEITTIIASCRACPHVTNSSKEHDDPFTSAPHPTYWWCKLNDGPDIISDTSVVHAKCPLRKKND